MDKASDRGAITVELALALPAVMVLLAVLLTAGAATVSKVSLAGAARAGARAAALGEDDSAVRAAAEAVGGSPLVVGVVRGGGLVRVTCGRQLAVPPFGSRLANVEAVAMCEPARGCG
ncbi:MAG: pilus assembly protein [Bifidobacteriaceae bacterium]|nr:pilus assembly protein [Bifidobacteriaceae bacterium]